MWGSCSLGWKTRLKSGGPRAQMPVPVPKMQAGCTHDPPRIHSVHNALRTNGTHDKPRMHGSQDTLRTHGAHRVHVHPHRS